MKFSVWLESREQGEAESSVLGVLKSFADIKNDDRLRSMMTSDFDSNVVQKLKQLDCVKKLAETNPAFYQQVQNSIEQGISISDLVAKIGQAQAPSPAVNMGTPVAGNPNANGM